MQNSEMNTQTILDRRFIRPPAKISANKRLNHLVKEVPLLTSGFGGPVGRAGKLVRTMRSMAFILADCSRG